MPGRCPARHHYTARPSSRTRSSRSSTRARSTVLRRRSWRLEPAQCRDGMARSSISSSASSIAQVISSSARHYGSDSMLGLLPPTAGERPGGPRPPGADRRQRHLAFRSDDKPPRLSRHQAGAGLGRGFPGISVAGGRNIWVRQYRLGGDRPDQPGAATNPRISPLLGERSGNRSHQAELAAAPRKAWTSGRHDPARSGEGNESMRALSDDRKLNELGLFLVLLRAEEPRRSAGRGRHSRRQVPAGADHRQPVAACRVGLRAAEGFSAALAAAQVVSRAASAEACRARPAVSVAAGHPADVVSGRQGGGQILAKRLLERRCYLRRWPGGWRCWWQA